MVRILFVCSGNICRSPTGEGVMRTLVRQRGLDGEITVDSAGIGGWHAGEPPDPRSVIAARERGVVLEGLARQISATDFADFDLLIAMDRTHERDLRRLAPGPESAAKVHLLRAYDPAATGDLDVPDPFYGGASGFEDVLDMVQAGCAGLLDEVAPA